MWFESVSLLLLALVSLFWLYISRLYSYWQRHSVASIPAEFPYGSVKQCLYLKKTIGEMLADFYRKYDNKKLIGFYAPFEPMLLLRDPELIKTVLVKEFNNFFDNGFIVDKHIDPLLGYNPFGIKGLQEWKQVRSIHTPTQSILKIKNMVPSIISSAENFTKFISTKIGQPIEMKDTNRLYTIDVVSKCAFGIESNTFFDKNSPMKMYTSGELFGTNTAANRASLSNFFMPLCSRLFRWRTMSANAEEFFVEMVKSQSEYRARTGQSQNDLMQHLLTLNEKADQGNGTRLSDAELAANCMTFFIDGVETSSVAMTFAMFEIANNESIQMKLRDEILSLGRAITDFDFDKISTMQYLDMVLSETLRKYPPVNLLSRLCTQETRLDGVRIKPGTKVFIPVLGLQWDPLYYPQPEKFIPERFTKENLANRHKFVYLPFGEGPRICLGFKFALIEIKIAIIAILLRYRCVLTNKSAIASLEFDRNSTFLTIARGDVNLEFEPL